MKMTCAEALFRFFLSQKSELFDGSFRPFLSATFGIYGHGNVGGIGRALSNLEGHLPFYRGQNEQGMVHTAVAYAKANFRRRIMAVTTSIGPGATNMVTGAALAHINRLPVLLLPGDIFASRRPDPVLQQLEHPLSQEISVNDCFRPVSRFFDKITRPEQLLSALPEAVRVLLDPVDCGPVTLAMPQDVQAMHYDFPEEFFVEKKHAIRRAEPDLCELEEASMQLSEAKSPLVIAGGGVHYSGACDALVDFCETYGIPFAETQAGKAVSNSAHPLNVGGIGVTGTEAANVLAADADVILAVGTRLSDFTTASKTLFPKAKIIGLNVSSKDAHKLAAYTLVADARQGLRRLQASVQSPRYQERVAGVKKRWESEELEQGTKLRDVDVLRAVNRFASSKGKHTVVAAAGGLPGELHRHWKAEDSLCYHLEYGYSCMGYEIAGAIGVKMAHPDRDIYVLVGDGSYLMLHQELLTARLLGICIHVILLNNRGFGCIHRLQTSLGAKPSGNLLATSVDFVANARSFGLISDKAGSLTELEDILKVHSKASSTTVTVIDTDPSTSSKSYAWWDVPGAKEEPACAR